GGVGLLTAIAVPILLIILLVLTLASLLLLSPITLPTALLIGIVFGIAGLYGWIALGLEVGNRLADLLQREWPI
ncbi:MAG: hypothetical protein GTO53_14265, partial [Planctomycetales bacterium]|nr:hypothetical protein [Planctomycetales bacterium]